MIIFTKKIKIIGILFLIIFFNSYNSFSQSTCAGALTLTPGTAQCGTNSFVGSFPDAGGAPANPCDSWYNDGEYWFKYTGTGNALQLNVSGLTDTYSGIYVLDACPSGTPSCISSFSNGFSTANYSVTTPALTLGTVYYIVIANWSTPYSTAFCLNSTSVAPPVPPANNNCSGAVSLTPGASCTATSGTVALATQSQAGCLGTANDDVWYSFVATNASQNITVTPSASFDPVVQVFSGTCASLTSLSCNDATFLTGTAGTMNITGLTVGQTYYYRIYDYYSGVPATTTFTTCITNPGVPNNQDCLGAIPICNNTYSTAIAYSGTGNILNEINSANSCLGAGEKNDVWYVFTVQASGNLDFTITPVVGTEDYDWAVYNLTTANCSDIYSNAALEVSCNFSANIGCSGLTGPNGNTTGPCGLQNEAVVPVTAGQTYVVNVSQYSATQNGYAIDFGASTATIFDNVPPAFSSVNTPIACGATSLTFNFSENVKCNTVSTADFTLTGPGGPYTITGWSSANCSAGAAYDNTFTITVNPALTTSGTFSLCLVNTAGSVADVCNNIAPPACFNYTISNIVLSTSQTNVTCNGGTNGVASVAITSGGTAPFSYVWNDPAPVQTTATATGLAAGTYTVTVTDALGCMAQATVTITQPSGMTLTAVPTNATCGASNGSINLTVTGGTAPFTYLWTNGSTIQDPTGLAAGSYTVTVTMAGGCTANFTQAITTTATPLATFTYNGNQCLTGNSFNFTNTGTSGGGATYSWTFPSGTPATSTTNNQSGVTWVASGTFTISHTVTQSGCSATVTQNIVVYPNPVPGVTQNNVTCNGACNGSATANPTGGAGFTYLWSNAATTQTISGLCAGSYTVTVTNSNTCIGTQTISITQPAIMTLVTSRTNATCNGVCNGTGNVTPSGGSGSYTYLWDNGQTTQGSTGLCAGNHNVTVTDASSPLCTQTATINISQPTLIVLTPSSTNATCGLSNGSASVAVAGGTAPYTYSWSIGGATNSITGLTAGSYTVTVTDNIGCPITTIINITNTTAPTANISASTNVSCNGGNNGAATVTAAGGTSPYTYLWTGGQTTATAVNLIAGTYTVTITDFNSCTITASINITQPTVLNASISAQTNNVCYNGNSGSATVLASGGTAPYTYSWNTIPVQSTVTATGLVAGTYTVTVTDFRGCIKITTVTITQPTQLTASISASTNVSCFGGNNGSATVLAGGGTPPYSYSWNPSGQTTATASNLTAGTYNVTVTDANGCTRSPSSVTITQPTALTASIAGTNVLCNGNSTGAANLTAGGGISPYTYTWSNTATTEDLTGLAIGTYTVTVRDVNNCTVTANITITQPTAISLTPSSTNATCGSANGSAGVVAAGGTSPYTYLWTSGQTTASISGLVAGAYTVTVTDANGCTANNTINVSNLGSPTASISAQTNVSCFGGNNGSATVSAAGGTSPYTYIWTGGQTTTTATNLTAGTYTVTVTDANSCSTNTTVTITQPAVLTASISAQTNVNCNGGSTGSATVSATGGTVPYTYLWTGGQTTANATNLTAGTYTVTVTDFRGCTQTTTATITQPAVLSATISGVNVLCNGGNTGSANLTVTGGTSPYTFIWSNTATTEDLSNLTTGTYTVTVTDNRACTTTANITITQPTLISLTPSSTNATCGAANGTAGITASGGTSPYTYLWTGGQTTASISGLIAGSYTVTVTDASLCTSTNTINVSNTGSPTASISAQTNILCNGNSTGNATVTAVGGTAPYTYLWTGGQTTPSATNLAAGTFTVTVTDNNTCSTTATVTITQPTSLTASISGQVNINCNGGNNGSATVNSGGGIPPYTYLWTGGQTTSTATNLTSGAYTVTVTDANLCTITAIATLTQPVILTAAGSGTNVTCNGGNNGTATATPSGGTSPYTYVWQNLQTTQTATGLSAGTYNVTITDANLCTATTSYIVTEPAAMTLTPGTIDATCGNPNGTASIVVSGGTAPYTYLWSTGGTANSIAGVIAGAYGITVTDNNSCTQNTTVIINNTGAPTASLTINSNALCNGICNGDATVSALGGTPPYVSYLWSNGGSGLNVTGLCAGTISVTVTDNAGCSATASAIITEPTAISSLISAQTNVSCFGGVNGSATVSASGGTSPYTYSWQGGGSSATNNSLAAGSFNVTVTDINSCTAITTATITAPADLTLSLSTQTNVLCNGGTTGSATVLAGGGTAPYTYSWSNGATGSTASGLAAVAYTVTVTDANSCTETLIVTITQPIVLTVSITTQTNVSCNAGNNGSATALATGGTAGFTYVWSNAANGATVGSLIAGTYSVTATDANSCVAITSVTITEPLVLTVVITSQTNVNCNAGANGSATALASGGTSGYNYTWSNTATGATASGLSANTYTVTATDANLCTSTATVTITQPTVITSSISSQTNISCNGGNNGTSSVTASGGILPFTYIWTNGSTASNTSNLIAGIYSVTVSDANLCTSISTVTITEPTAVSASIIGTDAGCNGAATGSATATPSGGIPGYTYSWSNGASGLTAGSLSAGNYTVTVTDASGCTTTANVTINEPTTLTGTASSTSETIFGLCDGTVTASPSGGVGGYTYVWSGTGSQTTQTATGLCVGTYTVTVTDANGCIIILSTTVVGPGALNLTATGSAVNCNGDCTGTANVIVTGGQTPYTYLWTGGQTNATATGLCAGTYSLTVTDFNGATANASATVTQPTALTSVINSQTNVLCNGGNNGSAGVSPSGGTLPYTYLWTGGSTSSTATNLTTGNYNVTTTDALGCTTTATVSITEPIAITAAATGTDVLCNGGTTGSGTVTASGGTPSYTYLWSNGATSDNAAGLSQGSYTVTITDNNSCTTTTSLTISQPTVVGATITSSTDVSGFGASDGSATANGTNGTPGYTYSWSNGSSGATANGLSSGSYTVTVTDLNGCTAITTVTINEPGALIVTLVSSTDVTCNGICNGTATISASGGVIPYTYAWSSGGTTANSTGLCSGTHTVTVTDANGFTGNISVVINQPVLLSASIATNISVSCNGGSNGSASITATGGITSYSYLWSNGNTTNAISNVAAGNYSVVVTDANLCTTNVNLTITEPLTLAVTVNAIGANCGQPQGNLAANVFGGTMPYTYLWTGGQTTQTAINLIPSSYSVTVTDFNNCTVSGSGVISNIPGASLTIKFKSNTLCNGSCDGTATMESTGGLTPYNYSCSSGFTLTTSSTNVLVSNLCAGIYFFTITDANGCQTIITDTIFEPQPVVAAISASSNVSCNSGSNGTATVSGSGGIAPYTAIWSTTPAQATITADSLTAGTYNVTLSDANACTAITSAIITQPTSIILSSNSNNEHCSQSDGSASVIATGGTVSTGYTFLWSGGSIPLNLASVNGLNSGGSPYTVTVTDNNFCTATATVTIVNLLPGTATISSYTNISCNGAADGTATASMGGGQFPFIYLWNTTPPQTGITATSLPAGLATVSVTDGFNCIVTASVIITQPNLLSNTFTQINASCFGSCNGSLTSVPSGGTLPYSYNWSTFNSTASIANLCSGSYSVTVTDANNCSGIFSTTITEPTQINITGVVTDANCNSTDGSINASASGGTIGYSYQWNTGSTVNNLTNVSAGTYILTVTDGAGCVASQNFNINNISGPTASISAFSNISCFGANDGFATVSVTGGSLLFSYQWNTTPAQFTASATNLSQGIYTVIVTDINTLCVVNASVTITEPAALTIQTITNEPLCFGQCNGDATVVPFGGTAPYSFLWFGGGNNPNDSTNTGLCFGSYTIVVTDANSCNTMQAVPISQPTFVSAAATSNPQSCYDICDGTATVSQAGGTAPYTYLWSGNSQSTITAVGLCSNSYSVTVTDNNGCITTANTTVTTPTPISVTAIVQHVTCFNGTNGRIILNIAGGTPGFNTVWSNGATTQNLIGISFGNYCVSITDQNGCTYDTCIIVSQPPQLQVSLTHTDETCYQFCDGTITPSVTGGQVPYTYLWSNFSTTPTADSLCPGMHYVTITDQNNCQASASNEIIGYDILSLLLVNVDTATCGQANGFAEILVIGGDSVYTYLWPSPITSTSSSASNLAAGYYTVTVTDNHNCSATMDINISNAAGPVIDSIVVDNVSCFGVCNGSLQAYYYGSTATYNVVWSNTQTGDTATNLCPGTYSVIITDQNGCATSTNRTITQPPLFQTAITSFANPTCYGTCNGSATQSVNGGTSPFIYLWSNGASMNSINNICAGTYTVTTTDANGCASQNAITITQPDSLHITPTVNNVTCFGQDNGQIIAQVTGGTGYFYNWFPNVSSNSVAAPLSPGTYTLIVTDYYDLNCSTTGTYVITEPEVISLSTLVNPTTCGLSNGMAYIIGGVHGGTSPYINIWSPGGSTNDTLYNAASGTYQLQIIDDNNCTALFSVFVPAIAPPLLNSLITTNVSCNGGNNGSATLNVKFGTGPFIYTWTPTIGSQTIIDTATTSLNNLVAGIYSVTITDNNGCPIQTAFIITQPSSIHTFADGSRWICNGQSATITANASGGTPPYVFTWSNLPSSNQVQVVSPTSTTNYSVFVTDQRGCLSDTGIVTIYVFPNVSVILTADSLNICRGSSTILHALASGGNGGPYNYHWESIYNNVQTFNDITAFADWTVYPIDTTTYVVHALDGCQSPSIGDTVTIIVWPVPQTSITVDKAFGCEPLTVSFNNTANMANMTYEWNFNDPESINNSSLDKNPTHLYEQDGVYIVSLTVTTEHGCSASDNQTINVYPVPVAAFFAFPEVVDLFHSTVEFTDITVDVNYWSWDFGDNRYSGLQNPEHTFDHADTFYVSLIVKNEYGCKDTVVHPIIVQQEFTFYAPTAFDPNSPINNVFNPQGVGIDERNYSLFVFDRWGQIMFETTDLYEYWNGRFNNKGQYVKSGSYVWVVKLKDIHGRWHEIPGNVTVIR